MTNRLFVYGTLGLGQSHEHLLTQAPGRWEKARVQGVLYLQGVGLTTGYPAIELREDGKWIEGYVYFSRQLSKLWDQLDSYEGSGYKRVITKVTLSNGKSGNAYIYELGKY
jgi:gamma-glutamylcyclotransferase (GGCT)/AIG2-like uncharacterized protein YtfP